MTDAERIAELEAALAEAEARATMWQNTHATELRELELMRADRDRLRDVVFECEARLAKQDALEEAWAAEADRDQAVKLFEETREDRDAHMLRADAAEADRDRLQERVEELRAREDRWRREIEHERELRLRAEVKAEAALNPRPTSIRAMIDGE